MKNIASALYVRRNLFARINDIIKRNKECKLLICMLSKRADAFVALVSANLGQEPYMSLENFLSQYNLEMRKVDGGILFVRKNNTSELPPIRIMEENLVAEIAPETARKSFRIGMDVAMF